jgi:AcrR family transcriptional regulator
VSTSRSGPIWTQPPPGSRRPRFTRAQIAEVAIRIADAEGFEALSMRRIADELGAGTMTLYHYVRTKEDLITLMDDALMAEVLLPPEAITPDWRASLAAVARASCRAFMNHPWWLQALSGARFGPNGMRHVEQTMAAVAHAPFDDQGKLDAIGIVDDYVFGFVFRRAELSKHSEFSGGSGPSQALLEFTRHELATGQYPHFAALVGDDPAGMWTRVASQMNHERRFELGLAALLDGLPGMLGGGGGGGDRTAPPRPKHAKSGGRTRRRRVTP